MGLAIFENYSSTSSNKGKLPPLSVDLLPEQVLEKLKNYLLKEEYYNIVINDEFLDIYAEQGGYEYSFQVTRVENRTMISISVFGENKRGRTRRELKDIYQKITSLFN